MPTWGKWVVAMLVAVGLIWIGWHVSAVLVTLHILVCFVLIAVIMLQSGNAADLAGAFGGAGSQTAFGPRGAATFLSGLVALAPQILLQAGTEVVDLGTWCAQACDLDNGLVAKM